LKGLAAVLKYFIGRQIKKNIGLGKEIEGHGLANYGITQMIRQNYLLRLTDIKSVSEILHTIVEHKDDLLLALLDE